MDLSLDSWRSLKLGSAEAEAELHHQDLSERADNACACARVHVRCADASCVCVMRVRVFFRFACILLKYGGCG